ncbi:hypothetical protein AB0J63_25100 [Streptosporangium canum]|uniref:hypothetical protein n=1 Tax=Streptosporangium canum TaxID=324952 RepID=UPI003429910A
MEPPYAGDPALLSALDTALGHYLRLQHEDGSWPEYRRDEHSMAATGFGTGYLSKTLEVLRRSGALPERQVQLRAALRTAMTWFLDLATTKVWQSRLVYANQRPLLRRGASRPRPHRTQLAVRAGGAGAGRVHELTGGPRRGARRLVGRDRPGDPAGQGRHLPAHPLPRDLR